MLNVKWASTANGSLSLCNVSQWSHILSSSTGKPMAASLFLEAFAKVTPSLRAFSSFVLRVSQRLSTKLQEIKLLMGYP